MPVKKAVAKKTESGGELQPIQITNVVIPVKGLSPLIMHRFSEKAKQQILDKQMGKVVKKELKDPEQDVKNSLYLMDDEKQLGFPADAFKQAMVRGAKQLGLTMVDMRTGFFVHGEYSERDDRELVAIEGELEAREDMVRLNGTTSDIRYRGQVKEWSADLHISFNKSVVTIDHIVNMLNAAGYGVGIGEWRPEKNGMFGRFVVEPTEKKTKKQ